MQDYTELICVGNQIHDKMLLYCVSLNQNGHQLTVYKVVKQVVDFLAVYQEKAASIYPNDVVLYEAKLQELVANA